MKILLFLILSIVLLTPYKTFAEGLDCPNRYLTLVNPVRSRSLWTDSDLKHLSNQYELIKKHKFSATWLIQYDILKDSEALNLISDFDKNQEVGLFLEVSEKLATEARVIYPYNKPWFSPGAIFLSGYTQSERRLLIDKQFNQFKKQFGFYPKSVGAWWIDAYSVELMKQKYQIESVMIVADQKSTDNYRIWGQWWGYPYYPSKSNILVPDISGQKDLVVIQWAQRHPDLAYGDGYQFSNFSLQANDYISLGLDTTHFKKLISVYLDCQNKLGQVTVGLETGIESVNFINEYQNQLEYLSQLENLESVTMNEFSKKYQEIYSINPELINISGVDSKWILSPQGRTNLFLQDQVNYNSQITFEDYFVADKNNFLDRSLENIKYLNNQIYYPIYLISILILGLFSFYKKIIKLWVTGLIFFIASYGLILKSHFQYGWQVFFGPEVSNLYIAQLILPVLAFTFIYGISKLGKKIKLNEKNTLIFSTLAFGVDPVIKILRISFISGEYYLGLALDSLRFLGFKFSTSSLGFINSDLPAYQAAGLLKFDFNKVWDNSLLWIIVYPSLHLILALGLTVFSKKLSNRYLRLCFVVLSMLFILHILNIVNADPRIVRPQK